MLVLFSESDEVLAIYLVLSTTGRIIFMKTKPDVSFNKNFPPSRTDDSRVASSACSWGVTWTVEFATTCLRYVSDLNLFSDFSTTGDSRGL